MVIKTRSANLVATVVALVVFASGCSGSDEVRVHLTGPSELDRARLLVDGEVAGMLSLSGSPPEVPRIAAAQAIIAVPTGKHQLVIESPQGVRIVKWLDYENGGEDYVAITPHDIRTAGGGTQKTSQE